MRPDRVGLELLDAPGEERPALPLRDRRDARVAAGLALERARPAEHIEVEARVRIASREKPLPAPQHQVELTGRPAVDRRRRQPRGRHELSRPGQAGAAVPEPAPVGQLVGQRAGGLELAELRGGVQRPLRMTRYQGSSAHLPGSNRAGYRAAARSTASMSGSFLPANHPAP